MQPLQIFEFQDQKVRTILIDNTIWFVAMDVAKILEYTDVRRMCDLADADDKRIENPQKLDSSIFAESFSSSTFKVSFLNESGVYACIFNSTKPEAKVFKKWVTSVVLPSIRKTGSYSINSVELNSQLQIVIDQVVKSNALMIESSQNTLAQIIAANKQHTDELMARIDSLEDENAELRFIQNHTRQALNAHPLSSMFIYVRTKLQQKEITFPKVGLTVRNFLDAFKLDKSQVRQIGVMASILYYADKNTTPHKSSKGMIYYEDDIIYIITACACKLNFKFEDLLNNYQRLISGHS